MSPYALRAIAVAIVVAGVVDPALTLERPVAPLVTIAVAERALPVRHATGSSAWASALRLRDALGRDVRVSLQPHDRGSRAAACPASGGCILVSDGPLPERLSEGAVVVGALRVVDPGPYIAITGIDARRGAHLAAASMLDVHVDAAIVPGAVDTRERSAASPPGRAVTLQVFDGRALVGAAEHQWPDIPADVAALAARRVEWVPLAAGPRRLRVVASLLDAGRIVASDEAEAAVDVRSEPARVLLHEPEATWGGTFVRRAIEADARFRVDARIQMAPGISVSKGTEAGLRREQLDEAAAVVVTAPERLTAGDVDLLEHYSRLRGGSVVLLPGVQPSGPITRLMPAIARMQYESEPQSLGPLRARDLLTFTPSPGVTVLASIGDRPIIVTRTLGRGRVIVSGAIDAWRYREGGGFARFWSSLIADAAGAAGSSVHLETSRVLLKPGEEATLRVERRTLGTVGPELSAEAFMHCGKARHSIRLWPEARIGSFTGSIAGAQPGACVVTAGLNDSRFQAQTAILVAPDIRPPVPSARAFVDAIAAHGGTVDGPGGEPKLAARARGLLPPSREPRDTRPMQSPWWMVPFAGCLGAEWALRRRAGLR